MTAREQNLMDLVPLVGQDAARLQAIARSLHRLDETACNGYHNDDDEAAAERRTDRLEAEARRIAADHGLTLYVQGDPRGWPLYLLTQETVDKLTARGSTVNGNYDQGQGVCPL